MKSNRRTFLKYTGLSGLAMAGSNILQGGRRAVKTDFPGIGNETAERDTNQIFNMCGYAAPKLGVVRTGFIGLGQRGPSHMMNMARLEGVEIKALCDLRPEFANRAKERLQKLNSKANPAIYSGDSEEWKKLCDRKDIDLIFIATPWSMHVPMATYAMEHDKHVCVEVPAAVTIDECWQLVDTSEKTRKHCMMMENCCYDFFELLTLNMARQGYFGEIIHGEGAYIHNLLGLNFKKDGYWDMWRLKENIRRNGNLYPTHGLGPICQIMNINRGVKLNSLSSRSGRDFMMGQKAKELAEKDDFYKPFVGKSYRGNMNTSTIYAHNGSTIMLQHDVTSSNVYSRIHKVVGTKGTALKYPLPARISDGGEKWLSEPEIQMLTEKYTPAIVKKVGEMAKAVGGHGGMDFMMDWRTIDCLRNGLPLDQDVYDAALWSSISPLSEWSVANNSRSINIPDFTRGSWITNRQVDISLSKGGSTGVKV